MKKMIRSTLCICLILLACALMFAGCASGTTDTDPEKGPSQTKPSASSNTDPTGGSVGAHTHEFGQWAVVTPTSCTQDGLQERSCSCGEKEQRTDPSTGHIPDEWIVFQDPSATEAGMKHQYCLICGTLLSTEVIPATAATGLSYRVNDDGTTCTVTGIGTCTDTQLFIGGTIDGYTVTAIGAWAFEGCSLRSVTISDSVTDIGHGAFSACSNLTDITLPRGITIIPNSAFSHCTSLKTIVIPENVTMIDYNAFNDCTALCSIVIPDKVTYIATVAFHNCTALTDITISDNVTYIGENVFENSGYYNNAANWENDVLYIGNHVVAARETISGDCVIKAGTKTICSWAFRDCIGLTGITIPEGLITIGEGAFYDCVGLDNISIPDSIRYMGSYVFYNTRYYNNDANWNDFVLYVGNHLVAAKDIISGHYEVKNGTQTIGDGAFSYCSNLTGITIAAGVTYIGSRAFSSCSSLQSVDLPDTITYIGEYAFDNCSDLETINLPDSVTHIGDCAFQHCSSLAAITIPGGVTHLGYGMFFRCSSLAQIHFTGTKAQWEAIVKEDGWDNRTGNYVVHCTDGDITK